MKGLFRYLSPFSPDQSGAVSVLYELGGIIVVLDAGGCAGNICGFDEPRWFTHPSAIYSAGLRDLDAILGRDDKIIGKIRDAVDTVHDAAFIALIGTPVPAVVATDLRALCRICEKRFGLPALATRTFGMEYYDRGIEEGYRALMKMLKHHPLEKKTPREKFIGILGATPLDLPAFDSVARLKERIKTNTGLDSLCYGMEDGLEAYAHIKDAEYNLVVSPSALKTARSLQEKYDTPYNTGFMLSSIPEGKLPSGRTLILHQQILACSLREEYVRRGKKEDEIRVATFFTLDDELKREGDLKFYGENDLIRAVENGGFDTIIADPLYKKALGFYTGEWIPLPHFPVSAEIHQLKKEGSLFR